MKQVHIRNVLGETSYLKKLNQELFSKERTALILCTVCLEFDKWGSESQRQGISEVPHALGGPYKV